MAKEEIEKPYAHSRISLPWPNMKFKIIFSEVKTFGEDKWKNERGG